MSELRQNLITGQWVILAENRGGRPQDVDVQQIVRPQSVCPFCEGNEARTPDEALAIRAPGSKPNGPGWRVRVVPNKYPALDDSERTSSEPELEGRTPAAPFELSPGLGVHEIIIESPRHLESITELSDSQVTEVLETYGQRFNSLREAKKYQSAIIFKNGGPTAGATLVHLHSQLLAFQIGAPMVGQRLPLFQSYANRFGNCPLCQIAGEISTDQELIVGMTPNFFAFCPFASRFANEMWIAPRQHAANFSEMRSEDLPELAILLRSALVKLERIVKLPAYNYIVHTAPFDTFGSDHYHWHIEILPRTSRLAGFELGTSCYINTVSPERAARMLREA